MGRRRRKTKQYKSRYYITVTWRYQRRKKQTNNCNKQVNSDTIDGKEANEEAEEEGVDCPASRREIGVCLCCVVFLKSATNDSVQPYCCYGV